MRLSLTRAGFGGREISAMSEALAASYMVLLGMGERSPVPAAKAAPPALPATGANTKTMIPMRRRSKRNE